MDWSESVAWNGACLGFLFTVDIGMAKKAGTGGMKQGKYDRKVMKGGLLPCGGKVLFPKRPKKYWKWDVP